MRGVNSNQQQVRIHLRFPLVQYGPAVRRGLLRLFPLGRFPHGQRQRPCRRRLSGSQLPGTVAGLLDRHLERGALFLRRALGHARARLPTAAPCWRRPSACLGSHYGNVQDMQHRDVDVLMLYPIDLVAVEERFGSWMTQYPYANYVTQAKLLQRGKVVGGAIEMAGRRFTTLVATFEPFPSQRLLDMMRQMVEQGGRVVWSGPPPVLTDEGGDALRSLGGDLRRPLPAGVQRRPVRSRAAGRSCRAPCKACRRRSSSPTSWSITSIR